MNPQPKQWAEIPSPPSGDDALTVEHLRRLVDRLAHALGVGSPVLADRAGDIEAHARLRRALDSLGKNEQKDDDYA